MIGFLRGKIAKKQPPLLLLDVHGVGYEVEAPMSTFYVLPDVGEVVQVLTHLIIREDAHILFAFALESERQLFRSLIKINGVGAKLALTILSGMSSVEFASCIQQKNTAALVRLPGIGKKTAERLMVEMQDKVPLLEASHAGDADAMSGLEPGLSNPVQDAISALEALGYKAPDASKMVRAVKAEGLASEAIIRQALRAVSGS